MTTTSCIRRPCQPASRRVLARTLSFVVALAGMALLVAPAVSAAATWTIQSTPKTVEHPALHAVSCGSSTSCITVGEQQKEAKQATLAEAWNGTAWSVMTIPNPTGSLVSHLRGVSCTSSTACMAVGSYTNSKSEDRTLIEHWNGTAWSILTTPSATVYLHAVSCTSATACTAVGNGSGAENVAERWNGTEWVIQAVPGKGLLASVSCGSATECTALGTEGKPTAEFWNGTKWSSQTPTEPPESHNSLEAVSCHGISCFAVGVTNPDGTSNTGTLAELSLLGDWAPPEYTPPLEKSGFDSVSCVTPTGSTWCVATGSYIEVSTANRVTLAEKFSTLKGKWEVMATPNPSEAKENELTSVSCTSETACTAIGHYHSEETGLSTPLVERYG